MANDSAARQRELRAGCTRFLNWHGDPRPAEHLSQLLAAEPDGDRYGDGGAVGRCEEMVAELLGKPAAVFFPSGTMAQQIALRIHADRRGTPTVAFHPTCHLELHEDKAYQRLHGLVGRLVGDPRRLVSLADLEQVEEPLAALLLELPQREIGGQLPAWDDLCAQVEWGRARGAAVHLDGARLWDAQPHYGRPLTEIAALFDTVYVSFYKLLGGISGACLLGEKDVVAEARQWRRRHGGTLFALWPYAVSAIVGLQERLPRVEQYVAHAGAIARSVGALDGVQVVPDPPVTPMMHLLLHVDAEDFRTATEALAEQEKLWTWPGSTPTDSPAWQRVELTVGDATMQLSPDEVTAIVRRLLDGHAG
jgi:threonine aldolase